MTPPAIAEGLSTWSPEHGLVPVQAQGGRLLVADSWLLRDGRVRGFDRHRERFLRSCGECGAPPLGQVVDFWQDMTRALPRTGEWFPRVELASGSLELRLLLRPAPPLAADVRVWAAGQPDPRTVPRRKGPDLDALARVRRRASGADAEEAVLIAPSGLVLEAANSSLFWWEDDTLCLPPPRLPLLMRRDHGPRPGAGRPHRRPDRPPRTLPGRAGSTEVWLVNALHGIRPVAAWTGRPMAPGPAVHAPEWRKWLDGLMEPLPDH